MEGWLTTRNRDEAAFYPGFELPNCVGQFSGPLLIVGTGRCVMEDLERYAPVNPIPHHALAIKQMGMFYPVFHHWWVSDTKEVPVWRAYIEASTRFKHLRIPFITHSNTSVAEGVDHHWQFNPRMARSAGMEATIAALAMGYAPIVLAGCPGDDSGHFFPDGRMIPGWAVTNYGDREHQTAWRLLQEHVFRGRVTSLSGQTREWLGAP